MSLHRSFLSGKAGSKHRNVLTREERLVRLAQDRDWKSADNSVYALPKVGNRKVIAKKAP